MVRIFTLTREQAELSTVETLNQQSRLFILQATIVSETDQLFAYHNSQSEVKVWVYPPIENAEGYFSRHIISTSPKELSLRSEKWTMGKWC